MCFYHEFRIKSDEAGCMIHCGITCIIDCIHQFFIKISCVYTRLTDDSSCCCAAAGYGTIIKKKNLCVLRKTESLSFIYRHISNNCSRRVFRQVIRSCNILNFYYIVSIKSSFNNRTGLRKSLLARSDVASFVHLFGCHFNSS